MEILSVKRFFKKDGRLRNIPGLNSKRKPKTQEGFLFTPEIKHGRVA